MPLFRPSSPPEDERPSGGSITKPGDINIKQISLYATPDFAGAPVDLTSLFLEMHIFEDSQRSFMYGHITLQDSVGLYGKLPILGEETIYVKFGTPNVDLDIEIEAVVYRVTDNTRVANNTLVYTLHFISKEYLQGIQKPVSRSYKDLETHEIADKFYDEYMKIEDYSVRQPKEIFIEKTLEKQWVVFPYWEPEKCLGFLAHMSVSEEYFNGEPLIFFEDRRGFHLRTIRNLIWDDGVKPGDVGEQEFLFYDNQPNQPGDTNRPADVSRRIKEFRVVSATNTADRIKNGYFKNKTINIDWERRKVIEKDYHINEDYELNTRVTSSQNPLNTKTYSNAIERDSHIRMISTRWGQKEDGGISGRTEETYDWDKFSHISNRIHRGFKGITVEVEVPGNSVRKLFDVIDLAVNEPDATGSQRKDKYLSGKYYINAIHHIITPGNYDQTLEVVKDTLDKPLERE